MAQRVSLHRLRKSVWNRVATVVLIALGLGLLTGLGHSRGDFRGISAQLTDNFFPRGETDPRVVVVGIDELAVDLVPEDWPFPRPILAELADRLLKAGAQVVAFDVVLDLAKRGDDVFADVIRGKPVILSAQAKELEKPETESRGLRVATDLRLPTKVLLDGAAGIGVVNVNPERDGVVRTMPLIVETETTDVPTLGLATYMFVEGIEGPIVQRPFGIEVGGRAIPTDPFKLLRVNFSAGLSPGDSLADDVSFVSAGEVLRDGAPAEIAGKIVLIGATAEVLGDLRQSPVAKQNLGVPGVFLHANVVNTLLTEQYLEDASTAETVGWVFFLAAAIGLLSWLMPLKFGATIPGLLLVGWLLWSMARFEAGVIPDLTYPPLAALFALMAGLVLRYLTEGKERRRVSALFAQYVPPSVAQRLVNEDRVDSVMQGERLEVSVLFCDLRGFTAQAATMEPGQVRLMLDTYYETLSQMVLDHGGTVMQYVGDEIYAAFGAPEIQEDHSSRALACAVAMQDARPRIGEELEALGLPTIRYGIGVNSGSVVSAIVGSSKKSQYSLVGDTVNIGARLCSQAREDHVCFPEHVREAAGQAVPGEIDDLGPIEFKNATRPIRVWRYWANRTDPGPAPDGRDLTAAAAKSQSAG